MLLVDGFGIGMGGREVDLQLHFVLGAPCWSLSLLRPGQGLGVLS